MLWVICGVLYLIVGSLFAFAARGGLGVSIRQALFVLFLWPAALVMVLWGLFQWMNDGSH